MKQRTTFVQTAVVALMALMPFCAHARQGTPPVSHTAKVKALQSIPQLVVPATDRVAELAADAKTGRKSPLRFAVPVNVLVNPLTHGTWEMVPGGRVWRLRIHSAGATDLNLGFSTCWLPEGATLHISSEDENYFQGPYSSRDNKEHSQLWTPVVPGARAVIELFVPSDAKEEARLVLSRVNCGYRDVFHRRKDLDQQKDLGGCNIDVICPEGNPWQNQIRSVALYSVEGVFQCSGTLVNNVSNNFRNFFLTAAHCGINSANASSVVVYWNFEAPACGQRTGGSLNQNQSGAIFRMSKNDVDVTLIELDDIPNSSFRVYYSGWDRTNTASSGAVGIHHPNAEEKSISFSTSPLTNSDNCVGVGSQTHWSVLWSSGVTEGGSSGSGIWDPVTRRLIGALSGGASSCEAPEGMDCYGKFAVAWASGNNSGTRLRDWLDPKNSGVMSMPGSDPNPIPSLFSAGSALVAEACLPANGTIDPGEAVTVRFSIQNFGGTNSVNLIATLLPTNGVTAPSAPQNFGVISNNGQIVTRDFMFTANGDCGSTITARLLFQEGTNNRGTLLYPFKLGIPVITLTQNFDNVVAPALPIGWINSASNSAGWYTTNSLAHSSPNSAFVINRTNISDASLISPTIPIVTTNAQIVFRHYLDTEDKFDGGVLEISYNNGPFNDIITAGGSFAGGGYNSVMPTGYRNPLATRNAWSGNSGGFLTTIVNLPATAAAQNIRLRWRLGTDESVGFPDHTGWYVDTVSIIDGRHCCGGITPPQIVETRQTNGAIVFSFDTRAGVTYVTEFKGGLGTNTGWVPLQTNAGNGARRSVTNSTLGATNRYFRVKAQ